MAAIEVSEVKTKAVARGSLAGSSHGVKKAGRRSGDEHGGLGTQSGRGIRGQANAGRWEMSTIAKPITVDRYEAMVASGEITPADRLVLIEGRLVKKMTKYPPHTTATNIAHRTIEALLPAGRHARKARSAFLAAIASPSPMSRSREERSRPTRDGIQTRATSRSSSRSRIRA